MVNHKKTFKNLLRYLHHHIGWILLTLLLAAVYVILSLYVPILTGDAIDKIIAKNHVDFSSIVVILAKIAVAVIVASIAQWTMRLINNRITYAVVQDIRNQAFEVIEHLPLSYLDKQTSGDIVSRIIADVDQLSDGLLLGFTQLFTGILTIFGTLYFMLSIHVKVTLVVVIISPISLIVASKIAKSTYYMFKKQTEERAQQTAYINEMITNQKIVQSFGVEEEVMKNFDVLNDQLKDTVCRATFYSSLTNPCTRFINALIYAVVGLAGALAAIKGQMTIGGLSCFLSYANQYTKPFNEISGVAAEFQNALACAERILSFIEESTEKETEQAFPLKDAKGKVQFQKISFSYTPERPLISDCSLSVQPGQHIAIVGPTGCGKTTLINLIMRFYDVDSGAILIDGHDIKEITKSSLRENIGMVLQETWIKHATVRENICMGMPDASEEAIIAAAKAAHAHNFICRLPQGYDTIISNREGSLSQGQRQLLCIARVMLCLPPILILDEATSSIDTRTERRIQSAFQAMMQGRTSFIVAHRLSTIQDADWIIVMRDGSIIEQGSHTELLKNGGFYATLYRSQFAN